jgi:hypothetical protein
VSVDLEVRERSANRASASHWTVRALLGAGWAPIAVFGAHLIASQAHFPRIKDGNAYAEWPWIDVPMHFFGGVAIAYFAWRSLREAAAARVIAATDRLITAMLVFGFTCAAAVFWEFAEFIADRWFGAHVQTGLEDTLGDMCFGICGGLVFIAALALVGRRAR